MTVYYKTTEGTIVRNCDLEEAYLIATGKHRYESERDWMLWLNSIWGKHVVSAHKANELSVEEIARNGQTFMAVHVYKELHKCDLREAHDAVKKMLEV